MHQRDRDMGTLQHIYSNFRDSLPFDETQFTYRLHDTISMALGKMDRLMEFTVKSGKRMVQSIPTCYEIKRRTAANVRHKLVRINNKLSSIVLYFGGAETGEREGEIIKNQEICNLTLMILQKYIQVNYLVAQHTLHKLGIYLKSPNTLLVDANELLLSLRIKAVALYRTINTIGKQSIKQVLSTWNHYYCEVQQYISITIIQLRSQRSLAKSLFMELGRISKLSIRWVRKGVEIVIDKQHYWDNFSQLVSHIMLTVGKCIRRVQQRWEITKWEGKDLYERTVKTYKMQKLLLKNIKIKELEREKSKKRSNPIRRVSRNEELEGEENRNLVERRIKGNGKEKV